MKKPNVLALILDEALARCADAGWDVEVVYTRAPGDAPQGKARVIRFKEVSLGKGVLTVAREQGMKGGAGNGL